MEPNQNNQRDTPRMTAEELQELIHGVANNPLVARSEQIQLKDILQLVSILAPIMLFLFTQLQAFYDRMDTLEHKIVRMETSCNGDTQH